VHEPGGGVTDEATPASEPVATRPRILVVDDEPDIRAFLSVVFEHEGYDVLGAGDAREARTIVEAGGADVLILDLDLPGMHGLEFLTEVRTRGELPVIVVSGRGAESDRVVGLDLGADDYLAKPFSPPELVARVRSLLRRTWAREAKANAAPTGAGRDRLVFGALVIDPAAYEVMLDGVELDLTRKEFELLHHLASSPHTVFGRDDLLAAVWGSAPGDTGASTVTEHIRRVRQKIEADPDAPRRIITVRGVGYRFDG